MRRGDQLGCPTNFNSLTVGWYLNEPDEGVAANVFVNSKCEFIADRDVVAGEELPSATKSSVRRRVDRAVPAFIRIGRILPSLASPTKIAVSVFQRGGAPTSGCVAPTMKEGLLVDGKWTHPGFEEGCRCFSKSVVPGFD
ncbi:MAG: hypothetical protein JWM91_4182 [Rhodospirillales bacterium]|nr:hypothetical protein [Rhodospirillales bacterium]